VVGGSSYLPTASFTVARFTTSGAPDNSFGNGGFVRTSITAADFLNGMAMDGSGRIVVTGYSNVNGTDISLARYTTDGVLDSSFGIDGIVTTHIGLSSVEFGQGVSVDLSGKIIVAGYTAYGQNDQFALVRHE